MAEDRMAVLETARQSISLALRYPALTAFAIRPTASRAFTGRSALSDLAYSHRFRIRSSRSPEVNRQRALSTQVAGRWGGRSR
jgi:hypothetical protein